MPYSGFGSQHNTLIGSTTMFSSDSGMLGTLLGFGGGYNSGNEQVSGNSEQHIFEDSSSDTNLQGKKQLNSNTSVM